jgi:Flp pilus assembly protein CpaB
MIAVAGVVAVLAGMMLLFFLNRYRASVTGSGQPETVLVATSLIEKGTPGDVIAEGDLFQTTTVKKNQVKHGAVEDPSDLKGQVAVDDIYPGAQLISTDFTKAVAGVQNKLTGTKRAITIPLDSAHGMIGDVQAGDHVDVLAGFNVQPDGAARPRPVLKTLLQDVLVLQAPTTAKSSGLSSGKTQNVVLRTSDEEAAKIAFSSDNGKVWIVLRPKAAAEQSKPTFETLETLLFGVKPLNARKRVRGGGH